MNRFSIISRDQGSQFSTIVHDFCNLLVIDAANPMKQHIYNGVSKTKAAFEMEAQKCRHKENRFRFIVSASWEKFMDSP